MNTENTEKPLDVLSEAFADFALDEMESPTRAPRRFLLKGQEFNGVVLGFGSSYSEAGTHKGHIPGTVPAAGERCSACRWADVAILRTDLQADGKTMYAILAMGKSAVPGESNRIRDTWTTDPLDVLRNMAVSGRDHRTEVHSSYRRIPVPNAIAFRYAAYADAEIKAVLDEHDDAVPDFHDKGLGQRF